MSNIKEALIRDHLVKNIEIIEPGLKFIEKELYLPKTIGTKGFIDLLAIDNCNRYVIIELKKAKSSSRQAIHEVIKYFEKIKEIKSIRNDEIRLIILSTIWDELIIPFSSFKKQSEYNIEGYNLSIDNNGLPLKCDVVESIEFDQERLFSNKHVLQFYKRKKDIDASIIKISKMFNKIGLYDHVFVILKAPSNYDDIVFNDTISSLEKMSGTKVSDKDFKRIKGGITGHNYILYSAVQLMSEDFYTEILKLKDIENFNEYIVDELSNNKIDRCEELYGHLGEYLEYPDCLHIEISYPAKLLKLLNEDDFVVDKVVKFGRFDKSELLTEEIIIDELKGSLGTNHRGYTNNISMINDKIKKNIINEIKHCLIDNLKWKQDIIYIIDNIKEYNKIKDIYIEIYNPMNIMYYLYLALKNSDLTYIPHYIIKIEYHDNVDFYCGTISTTEKELSFTDIIEKHYNNEIHNLSIPTLWGGYQEDDSKIMKDLGMRFESYFINIKDGHKKSYKFKEFEFEEIEDFYLNSEKENIFKKKSDLINEIYKAFSSIFLD